VPDGARESEHRVQGFGLRADDGVLGLLREIGILERRQDDFVPDPSRVSESDGDPRPIRA
jgi:hypothetical protein